MEKRLTQINNSFELVLFPYAIVEQELIPDSDLKRYLASDQVLNLTFGDSTSPNTVHL